LPRVFWMRRAMNKEMFNAMILFANVPSN
jgi:hypothetical protein